MPSPSTTTSSKQRRTVARDACGSRAQVKTSTTKVIRKAPCITSYALFLLGGRTGTQRQKTSMTRMPARFSWHDSQSASSCRFEALCSEASRSRRSYSVVYPHSREIFLSFLRGAMVSELLLLSIRHAPGSSSSSGSELYGATPRSGIGATSSSVVSASSRIILKTATCKRVCFVFV